MIQLLHFVVVLFGAMAVFSFSFMAVFTLVAVWVACMTSVHASDEYKESIARNGILLSFAIAIVVTVITVVFVLW